MFHPSVGTFFMLYTLAKILMTVGLRFFYRKIYVSGLENIPPNGPAILIANHHSSLMDAAVIGILSKRAVHFFTRGDVFVNGPVKRILSWLHMMPVHAHGGGRKTINANDSSFSEAEKILASGGVIIFFPESTSHIERQIYPLRKGVFRLAFGTVSKQGHHFNIPIVPVGISYAHPTKSRTDLLINMGEPIDLAAYRDNYETNSPATLLRISKDAYTALCKECLHIDDPSRLVAADFLLAIHRTDIRTDDGKWAIKSKTNFQQQKEICNKINTISDAEVTRIQMAGESYFEELKKKGISDTTVVGKNSHTSLPGLIAGLPVFITGILLNSLPIFVARKIADKKVYRKDFYSWIFVACYTVLYFLWLTLLTILLFIFGGQYALAGLIITIASGIFAFKYTGWYKQYLDNRAWVTLDQDEKNNLVAARQTLRSQLQSRVIN
ncbi:MAG: 1-acyl-sn-glycerol-3-phosphate acyltransferase [Gemmatimonadaceae bacterium]|nr:1-acyl-sn-glycerol-3-phosphate acyltransferase [Chitinophagaceae bacterium]